MASIVLRHLRVMLRRNALVAQRRYKSTLGQILTPLVICLMLLVFQQISNWVLGRSDANPPAEALKPVEPCEPRGTCAAILYAPAGVEWVDRIMRRVATGDLVFGEDVRAFDAGPMAHGNLSRTYVALYEHLLATPNLTRNAVLFHDAVEGGHGRGHILFYNSTVPAVASGAGSAKAAIDAAVTADLLTVPSVEMALSTAPFPRAPPRAAGYDVVAANGALWFYCAPLITFFLMVVDVVTEKERQQRLAMQRVGLGNFAFWFAWFLHGTAFVTLNTTVLIASGFMCQFPVFTNTNIAVTFLTFWLFGVSMVCAALFLSTLVSKQSAAQTASYAVILVGFVFVTILSSQYGAMVDLLYSPTIKPWVKVIRWIFSALPPFSLSKMYYDIAVKSGSQFHMGSGTLTTGSGFGWADLSEIRNVHFFGQDISVPPPWETFVTMAVDAVLFLLLTWYFDNVLGDHGMRRHPLFFASPSYWFGAGAVVDKRLEEDNSTSIIKGNGGRSGRGGADGASAAAYVALDDGGGVARHGVAPSLADCDPEVVDEHHAAARADPADFLLVVRGLGMRFGGASAGMQLCTSSAGCLANCCGGGAPFDAVSNVSLVAGPRDPEAGRHGRGDVLALVGHNGAGKTTFINMITGMYKPTSGQAFVCGVSVATEAPRVRSLIAVVPQHDVSFGDLSCAETIALFAGLRGIPDVPAEAKRVLGLVGLWEKRDALARQLSGGMLRRLSVGL
jgi:ABC-type multidrug transport system fused ATPase/permease subunit